MDNCMRTILADRTSYHLLWFLMLNLIFAFVELVYGMWANSLGLISDSFHMFFDCTALVAGLVASVISQWEPNEFFTFGYVRAEILAGFVNGLCLLMVAFFIFSEALKRALDPPMVRHESLLLVSVAGFLVNVVGIFVFHYGHSHEPGSVCPSRLSMSRKQSIAFLSHYQKNVDPTSSTYDGNIADPGYRHISRTSSHHEHTHTDQESSSRNISRTSKDHEHTDQVPSRRNVNIPSNDRTPPSYSDQDLSQRNISHASSDHEQSPSSVRDRSHNDHSHGSLGNVKLRPNFSSASNPPATSVSQDYDETFSVKTTSSSSEIVHGVYLHILADTLGSVGVIISSSLINMFGWVIADPICSMFISALVIISVVPLLQESMFILMQRTPVALDQQLPICYDKVSHIEGVYSIQKPHFWTLCTDVYVGALKLEVDSRADSQYILSQTQMIFHEIGVQHLHIQIEEESV